METITAIGQGFLDQKDYVSASAVFEGVIGAAIEDYGSVDDEGGELYRVVGDCVAALGECLTHLKKGDPARREAILRALFEAFEFTQSYGSDFEEDIPNLIAKQTTDDERRTVVGWIRDAISESSEYRRKSLGDFLITLEGDRLDDDSYLKICREFSLVADLVDRLLKLNRLEEALQEIKRVDDTKLLGMANLLVSHRKADVAERLVLERAEVPKNDYERVSMLEWLKARAKAKRDKASILELAKRIFRKRPTLEGYKELRTLASKKGGWDALRPQLLEFLKKQTGSSHVLTQIYLDEGEIDQALEMVKSRGKPPYGYYDYGDSMRLEVAKAAEKTRPQAAIEIYRKKAEDLIEQRGRGNYQEACRFLRKVKDLYKQIGEPETWGRDIADLRERNRALSALKEELTKAKL